LEEALSEFAGTIIFVSHDRYLLNKLASRVLEITADSVQTYDGGFEGFMSAKRERRAASEPPSEAYKAQNTRMAEEKNAGNYRIKEQRAYETKRRVRIKVLEDEINSAEVLMAELQREMSDPKICADYQLLQEKCELFEETKKLLSGLSDEWLTLLDGEE
jgi:ATP-binding cassette subfamily F protein 3